MKTRIPISIVSLLVSGAFTGQLFAQGNAFTYQGRLNDGASPAVGVYDFTFALFTVSSGAGQVSGTLTNTATAVSNGVFTVTLDFGAGVFDGNPRWLEIAVRTNGGGIFSALIPRQALTPTPYAIFANTASNFVGAVSSAQLSGTYSGPVNFNNGADSFSGTFIGQFFGSSFTGGNFSGNFIGTGSGTWINASDRNLKENFAPVNPREVLEKVAQLPIARWNYKTDGRIAHLGLLAQDFYQQFELGADDISIATMDEGGVALAAIQGLNQKLAEELKRKDAENWPDVPKSSSIDRVLL